MTNDGGAEYERHEWPQLREPTLVVMLAGWIDAGAAGATAMALLETELEARPLATFNSDTFIDYRARRPVMELREGVNTRVVWPEIVLKVGRDRLGNDVLLLTGHEPDSAWQRFTRAVVQLSAELGVVRMIGLGAYPIGVPHTRSSRLSLSCSSETIARSLPYLRNSVDVPAGVAASLERALADKGTPTIGLWAQVPHYVANMPYPAAAAALLGGLRDITGITTDLTALEAEAQLHKARVDALVAGNEEHVAMLHQLELAYDAEDVTSGADPSAPPLTSADLASGDELAAELERYLREQGR